MDDSLFATSALEFGTMNGDDGAPLVDRPKMAEALASLREGLGERADPLYDSWKLPKPLAAADGNAEALAAASPTVDTVVEATPAIDTVPVRVVRYTQFPKWAIIVLVSSLVFAASVGLLRRWLLHPSGPSIAAVSETGVAGVVPEPSSTEASPAGKEAPRAKNAEPERAASGASPAGSAAATALTRSTPARPRAPQHSSERKTKTIAPGFFRDPGF